MIKFLNLNKRNNLFADTPELREIISCEDMQVFEKLVMLDLQVFSSSICELRMIKNNYDIIDLL